VFYVHDSTTGKQESLGTRDRAEATTLFHSRNESFRQPHFLCAVSSINISHDLRECSDIIWVTVLPGSIHITAIMNTPCVPHQTPLAFALRSGSGDGLKGSHHAPRRNPRWLAAIVATMICVWRLAAVDSNNTNEIPASGAAVDHSKSIVIHQEIEFPATASAVYQALLDSKQFTTFSSRPAEISPEVGGAFSLFGGHIIGRNVELVPNQRIVQVWRVVTWPEGIYSIARFDFKPQPTGSRLVFSHTGFPEGLHDHLAEGWQQNYWDLLKKHFAKQQE